MKGSLIGYYKFIASKINWLISACAILAGTVNLWGQTYAESPIYTQFGLDSLAPIEVQIDELLNLMTLEEKIGQMSQVRHFKDINEGDIVRKHIGSVIHTQGPTPGTDAYAWQAKFKKTSRAGIVQSIRHSFDVCC